jgi:hypothetical protein
MLCYECLFVAFSKHLRLCHDPRQESASRNCLWICNACCETSPTHGCKPRCRPYSWKLGARANATSCIDRNFTTFFDLVLQATQKTPDLAEVVARAGAPACLQTFMTLEAGNREGMLAGCMIIGTVFNRYRFGLQSTQSQFSGVSMLCYTGKHFACD